MARVAIFPGSFDPFTRGHQCVVDEALKLFDRVVIAIGHNTAKRGMLSPQVRKQLIEEVYAGDERVEVTTYTTLTGDEARRVGASAIVRSVRSATDFDYERTIDRDSAGTCRGGAYILVAGKGASCFWPRCVDADAQGC